MEFWHSASQKNSTSKRRKEGKNGRVVVRVRNVPCTSVLVGVCGARGRRVSRVQVLGVLQWILGLLHIHATASKG